MKTKPKCETLIPWLKSNLGSRSLAPLTGTDARALAAAIQIIELYCYCPEESVIEAFAGVVRWMQPHTQELAYHAIAHVMNWEDRSRLWQMAELPHFPARVCAFEPGGDRKEAA